MYSLTYIGADWCAPCRVVKPEVQRLAQNFGVPLTILDYDTLEEPEQATVAKLPTIRIFNNEATVLEITTNHVTMLESWLKEHIDLRVNATDDF